MRNLNNFFIISIGCLLNFSPMINAEIYKWTDENGKVHYSDKPFDNNSKKISINKAPSEKQIQAAQNNADRLIERERRIRENQNEDQRDAQKKAIEKKKVKGLCDETKKELGILMTPVRVYQKDENGKEIYLGDDERKKEIEIYKETLKLHCSD